jgi:rhodanese-related sulfurtransferase
VGTGSAFPAAETESKISMDSGVIFEPSDGSVQTDFPHLLSVTDVVTTEHSMSTRILSITPQRFDLLRKGDDPAPLIDVRTPAEYRAGHIPGARLLPLDALGADGLDERLGENAIDRDQVLFVTCQSGARAQQAAERLTDAGYRNLVLIKGGTEAWERAGLPVKRCGAALALERQVQITVGLLLILKVIFGFAIHELFFAAAAFIGAGLIVAGVTRWCGMARLLAVMPWNRGGACPDDSANGVAPHA